MKKLSLIFLILICMIFIGCTKTTNSVTTSTAAEKSKSMDYDINKTTYTNKQITINYPQITNLSDSSKQKKINELIKTQGLSILNDYSESINNLNLKINYEIKWKSSNILSIEYSGTAYVKGTAHPSNGVFNTTNININTESVIKLQDIVTINKDFAEKYKNAKYKSPIDELNSESNGEIKKYLANFAINDLLQQFKDKKSRFYFTKDSLGINIDVPHAIGDTLELEVTYKNLSSFIKTDNKIWKEFIKDDLKNNSNSSNSSTSSNTDAKQTQLQKKQNTTNNEITNKLAISSNSTLGKSDPPEEDPLYDAIIGRWIKYTSNKSPYTCSIYSDRIEIYDSNGFSNKATYEKVYVKHKGEEGPFTFFSKESEVLFITVYYDSSDITKTSAFCFSDDKKEMKEYELNSNNTSLVSEKPNANYKLVEKPGENK